jgi:hypothetical protein
MTAMKLVVGSWRGPNGALEISQLAASVVYLQLTGVNDQAAAPVIERTLTKQFAQTDRLATFWDLGELVNYHSDVRIFATRALLAHRKQIIAIHTFTRSKLVAMGVSVANLALGGIVTAHPQRGSFEVALSELLTARAG